MAGLYVMHEMNQFAGSFAGEGVIVPLLRFASADKLTWAFAVPKPSSTADNKSRRKNELACSVLQALGFRIDADNGTAVSPFDKFNFFHLPDGPPETGVDPLIDPILASNFTDTLPDFASPSGLTVVPPKNNAPNLKLTAAATTTFIVKQHAKFGVAQFEIEDLQDQGNPGEFRLGPADGVTSPSFTLHCRLEKTSREGVEFPNGIAPRFGLKHTGLTGPLMVAGEGSSNDETIIPNNDAHIALDIRHDRMVTKSNVRLIRDYSIDSTDFKKQTLAIDIFPAITFLPNKNLPVTVSIESEGVCVRLRPREMKDLPEVRVNHLNPCVRVVIRGPVIHADASFTGALEAVRLLEPAERTIEDTVEQFNDFLTYSFQVCLPKELVPNLKLPELLRFEHLMFKVPDLVNMDGVDLKKLADFFHKFGVNFSLPDVKLDVDPIEIDLKPILQSLNLGFPQFKEFLNLPDFANHLEWAKILRVRLPNGLLMDPLTISSLDLEADFTLKVHFNNPLDLKTIKLEIVPPNFDFDLEKFDFRFPDLGLPALNQVELPIVKISGLKVKVLLTGLTDLPSLPELWKLRVKAPGMPAVAIEKFTLNASLTEIVFDLPKAFDTIAGIKVVVKWQFKLQSINLPDITLATKLPKARIPKIPGLPDLDFRMLKLRVIKFGVDLASFAVKGMSTDFTIKLDVPDIKDFPALKVFKDPNIVLEFALDLGFPLTKCFLNDLLGDLPTSIDFRLSIPRLSKLPDFVDLDANAPRFSVPEILEKFGSLSMPLMPFELAVRVPHPTLPRPQWDELRLVMSLPFDLEKFQLGKNRIYFFLPQVRSTDSDQAARQSIDCDIFTLTFPNRPEPLGFPVEDNHDGYFDLTSREFVIDLKYKDKVEPPPRVRLYFPGGMSKEAAQLGREGVDGLEKIDAAKFHELKKEYSRRFELELDSIDPAMWPNSGPNSLAFRLNSNGLTFAATLGKTEVLVDDTGFGDDGASNDSSSGLIKPFKLQPQEKQRELKSRVVIIDNELKEAGVYAKSEVPGVDGLIAEVSVVLRQARKGSLPEVIASMELQRSDNAPIAELSIKLLQLSLERIAMSLIWRRQEKEWDYSVIVDGTIAFTGAAALVPDLEGLRAPSIQVVGLDLRRLNLRALKVPLILVKPVRFEILDGLFGVELGDLELGWEFTGGIPKPRLLACQLAKLEFKNPGALEVSVSVGGLHIEFQDDLSAHVRLPSSLGIEVALGPTARFAGRVGWIEEPKERYLFAEGKVTLQGLPEIKALLKFGTGLKDSGRREIGVVLYGEMALDEQLFAGAVVKSLGLGIGLNHRLSVIPPRPSADQIIARIDKLAPGQLSGWQFVTEGGFYLSIVGSVMLASNLGDEKVLNAYVAQLVVSFDTNFDIVAAGKCWLSSSLKGVLGHLNNPAFVGAMVLSPSQRKLEVVLQSRKNAYVENNALIQKLLDKGNVRFAFRMTPDLVDFHLQEFSYLDEMFGVTMEYRGEYRFAIFKRAVLLKSELSATGSITRSLTAGPGGFDMDGQAHLAIGYGGLLSDRGIMAYAFIDAGIRFRVSAWIEIGFSISFRVCGKRFTFSWTVVFRLRVPELELTFRGNIAASDSGGVSVDVQVGINIVICGYPLRASGRLAVNPELYQQVRNTIAAFEQELNDAVRKLESAPPAAPPGPSPAPMLAPAPPSFALALAPESPQPTVPAVESWLLYSRDSGDSADGMLLPSPETTWLTPTIASLRQITLTKVASGFEIEFPVFDPHGPLSPPNSATGIKVRLLGMRGVESQLKNLDNVWPVKEVKPLVAGGSGERSSYTIVLKADSLAFDLSGSTTKTFAALGGVWNVEESAANQPQEDHQTVPYLNDVERLVIPISEWFVIDDFNSTSKVITTHDAHGLTGAIRIAMRKKEGEDFVAVDGGAGRVFDSTDIGEVTVVATVTGTNTLKIEATSIVPQANWKLAQAIEIAPTWNARNRLAFLRRQPSDPATIEVRAAAYRQLTGAAAAWAETATYDVARPPVTRRPDGYAVVFDERYTSADPRFTIASPPYPGVLSTRFRAIDQVEIVGADRILNAARRFEEASAQLGRQEIHGALDLLDDEAIVQSRAQASNLLVHRFSDPQGLRTDDHAEAPYVKEADPSKVIYGWLFSFGANAKTKIAAFEKGNTVIVRRAGDVARLAKVARPGAIDPSQTVGLGDITLPVRQEFVVNEVNETRESARLLVKLPIKFPERFLRKNLAKIGRFQIFRQIGNGQETPIADHLRPDISFLHEPQVYDRVQQLFVNHDAGSTERDAFRLTGTANTSSEKNTLTIDAELARQLPEVLEGFTCVVGPARNLRIVHAEKGVLELEGSAGANGAKVEFELHAHGLIVPRPILFSDSFNVENRAFVNPELLSQAGGGFVPTARYSLRPLPEDDAGGAGLRESRFDWEGDVPLFVPQPSRLPRNLALAVSVSSLIVDERFVFQLVDLSGELPVLAQIDRAPLSADDFELGLDDGLLTQSGFFAGDSTQAAISQEPDGEKITLDSVNVADRTKADIKIAAPIEGVAPFVFAVKNFTPRPIVAGRSYRFFLRAKGDAGPGSHLPILVVRKLPREWDETTRFRSVETLELIPRSHVTAVQSGDAIPVLTDFSADDLYDAGRSAIRVVWPSLSMMDGGVEIQFRDFDDSSMRSRTMVEVLEANEFAISQQDFRNVDFWVRRPSDRLEHYASRLAAGATAVPTQPLFDAVYLKKTAGGKVPIIELLEKITTDFLKPVPPHTTLNWFDVAQRVQNVQAAILNYEKSPINLNKPEIRQLIEKARIDLRSMIVGGVPNADFLAFLTTVEQQRPEPMTNVDAEEAAFLDRDTARKLAGLLRRRLAIADDVLSLRDISTIPGVASFKDEPQVLARQTNWNAILDDATTLSSEAKLPNSAALKKLMVDWAKLSTEAKVKLTALVSKINDSIADLCRLAPRAAGLLTVVKELENVAANRDPLSLGALLKRPHHELTTTRDDTGEVKSREVALCEFLPPDARRAKPGELPPPPDERLERLGMRVSQVATLDKTGSDTTLTLWTTRGSSVRTEPMRRVQQFKVDDNAKSVELAETRAAPVVLITTSSTWVLRDASTGLPLSGGTSGSAAFAETARGLEILSSQSGPTAVTLHSAETPGRDPLKFKSSAITSVNLLAYHQEVRAVAATSGDTVFFWRDLGLEDHTITSRTFKAPDGTVLGLASIMLPLGPRFVVATAGSLYLVDPFDARPQSTFPPPKALLGDAFESLAVDRRELKAVVRLMSDGSKAKVFDLREFSAAPKPIPEIGAGKSIAILHGRHEGDNESYVIAPQNNGTIDVRFLASDNIGNDFGDNVQTLPKTNSLKRTGNEIFACSSALARARSSRADEILNLLNLWERMGFALDIAAQVETTRLMSFTELRDLIDRGLDNLQKLRAQASIPQVLKVNDQNHYVYVFEGEEPDGEFRNADRVGFSHAKIAVVPEEFLLACLTPLTIAFAVQGKGKIASSVLTGVAFPQFEGRLADLDYAVIIDNKPYAAKIGGGGLQLAGGGGSLPVGEVAFSVIASHQLFDIVTSPNSNVLSPLKSWLANRAIKVSDRLDEQIIGLAHVIQMTRLVGVPTADGRGTVTASPSASRPDGAAALPDSATTHLQPRSDRFVKAPASAGSSHWAWILPDEKGHRMMAAARRVSRYEPLLRWWLNLHTRFDLVEEIELFNGHIAATDNSVTLAGPLPPVSGFQPLRLEIVSGFGAGQRRELPAMPPGATPGPTLTFDPEDPWLERPDATSVVRVMDAAPGWRMTFIDPIHDPVLGEGPRPLMVYQYPHSRWPRFSYQIPLDGMRSNYNQISRVRTGYHGVELTFRYFLQMEVDPDKKALNELLAAIETSTDSTAPPSRTTTTAPLGAELLVHLFRHERMLKLPQLPFFYQYRIDVRSAYQSRRLETDRAGAADLLPEDLNLSPPASRRPACLGLNDPSIKTLSLPEGTLPAGQPAEMEKVKIGGSVDDPFAGLPVTLRVLAPGSTTSILRTVRGWKNGVITVDTPYAASEKPQQNWKFVVIPPGGFEVVLFVSANRDHLTREEAASEPKDSLSVRHVEARDLPDFFMDYSLLTLRSGNTPTEVPSVMDLFTFAGAIAMPWSPNYPARIKNGLPFVALGSGLKGFVPAETIDLKPAAREFTAPLERVTISVDGTDTPFWRLRFWIVNDQGQSVVEADKLFVQGRRNGGLTRAVQALTT